MIPLGGYTTVWSVSPRQGRGSSGMREHAKRACHARHAGINMHKIVNMQKNFSKLSCKEIMCLPQNFLKHDVKF